MSQAAHLSRKLERKTEKAKLLKKALLLFVGGYPDRQWEHMLHEEGCPGTKLLKEERALPDPKHGDDGEQCECDGDYAVALVKRALR